MINIRIAALFLLLSAAAVIAAGQSRVTWETLKDVKFTDKFSEELGAYIQHPSFGPSVLKLAGQEIEITGYVIPLDIPANIYVLSGNPFASCFFCGGGGPESVMDLKFAKAPRRFRTDERVTFRGKLKLNTDDIYSLTYILESAMPVK